MYNILPNLAKMIRDYILFDGFTIIILINILLITIAKSLNNSKFNYFLQIYLNNSFIKFNSNENNYLSSFNSLLNTNFIISSSLFISTLYFYNTFGNIGFEIFLYLKTLLYFILFIYSKYLLEIVIGWSFKIDKFVTTFNKQRNSFNKLIGIIIILLNSLTIYTFPNSLAFLKISIIIIVILYTIGLYKAVRLNDNLVLPNMFYFILYLCTLEILPILFIINKIV